MGLDPIKLRRKARDFALKTVKSQRNQFQRYASCLLSHQEAQYHISNLCQYWIGFKAAGQGVLVH